MRMMTNTIQKKFRLFRAYAGRHPIWCTWQVTYRCNFRCGFCGYWQDEMARQPEQSVEDFETGSRKLARWGTMLISLAGGEPLLRKDLVDVVAAVGQWHFPFITTNGYKADERQAQELFRAGLWGVSVSIDYADADRHDQARGVKGAFERAVEALKMYSAARRRSWQRVNLMMVLLDDNLDQVEPLLKLAESLGTYLMIQPYSTAKTGDPKYRFPQNGGASDRLVELRRRYGNFLSNPWFLSRFDEALNGGIGGCAAGRAFFNIDSTGDIAICVERRAQPVANLYRDEPVDILNLLRSASRDNACRDCWYNCRGEVESLYRPYSLVRSLPTYFFDRGRPKSAQRL
jgi:MoaA/NifB/PqqE/SkfB family radical SAM enzyme